MKSDSGMLRADQVTHVRALGEMTAVGHVSLTSDSLDMTSDWLYNSEPQDLMFARGKVVVIAKANNTIISGDTLARFGNPAGTRGHPPPATQCSLVFARGIA